MNSKWTASTDYYCYLLRLRRDGEARPWRASLHCAATGTLHHFANMVHLFAFLRAQTGGLDEPVIDEPRQGG